MAIAGEIMPSCRVRVVDGNLVADSWQQRHKSVMVQAPVDALANLAAGEVVILRTTGNQWNELQTLWAAKQSPTTDDGKGTTK